MNVKLAADAVLLVGHGTRNPIGQLQFLRLAEDLRAAIAPVPLEVAYIELQSPLIADALVALDRQGRKNVVLSPALLFAAGHAKKDLPVAVASAMQVCPELEVRIAEPLGCHESVLELAAARFSAAVRKCDTIADTAIVVVGRGSSDADAIAHCQEFARLLGKRVGVSKVSTGFLAIAAPNLTTALDQAAASGAHRIVVQPQLLFTGEMQEATATGVAAAQCRHPQVEWLQAGILGADLLEFNSIAGSCLINAFAARLGGVA